MVGRQIPTTPKYAGVVTTVDPEQRQIGIVMKGDTQERNVFPVTTPPAFRWPMVNEGWVIRMENGAWILDGVFPALTSTVPFTAIPPGDLILNTPTGIVHVIGSVDGSTDFAFDAHSVPTQGRATLIAGTVTVLTSRVTTTSNIILTAQDNNSVGVLRVSARTPGTSFVITSSNGSDHGSVAYMIFG